MIKSVWVLGAGKFGFKAVERIKQIYPRVNLTVVDQKRKIPQPVISARGVAYVRRDGIDFLNEALAGTAEPDWIIPAIPVHVACEWIKCRLSITRAVRPMPVPEHLADMLPNTLQGKQGEMYSSMADFLCPDDCNEPQGICTVTKDKRAYRLYDYLASIQLTPYKTVVVKSRQICPGVGGYRPVDLFSALEDIRCCDAPILLATSCKCHAVVSAFQ
jgi:hypothetical protein